MMSSSPKPPSPQARSREILVSPAKSAFLSPQFPPSHVPPQTWLEDGTARRTNETKALGDAPQVPICEDDDDDDDKKMMMTGPGLFCGLG